MWQHKREPIQIKEGRNSAFAYRCAALVAPARQPTVLMPALRATCRVNELALAARSTGSKAAQSATNHALAPDPSADLRNAHLDWASLNISGKRRST